MKRPYISEYWRRMAREDETFRKRVEADIAIEHIKREIVRALYVPQIVNWLSKQLKKWNVS